MTSGAETFSVCLILAYYMCAIDTMFPYLLHTLRITLLSSLTFTERCVVVRSEAFADVKVSGKEMLNMETVCFFESLITSHRTVRRRNLHRLHHHSLVLQGK